MNRVSKSILAANKAGLVNATALPHHAVAARRFEYLYKQYCKAHAGEATPEQLERSYKRGQRGLRIVPQVSGQERGERDCKAGIAHRECMGTEYDEGYGFQYMKEQMEGATDEHF